MDTTQTTPAAYLIITDPDCARPLVKTYSDLEAAKRDARTARHFNPARVSVRLTRTAPAPLPMPPVCTPANCTECTDGGRHLCDHHAEAADAADM